MRGRAALVIFIAVLILAGGSLVYRFANLLPSNSDSGTGDLGRPLRVGIVSWRGYAGGLVANGGFKPNTSSIYSTKYHQQVEFVLLEDVDVRAKAFARGDVDVVWTTVDFWANELPGFVAGGVPAKAVLQVDWSRGGDAIVADSSVHTLAELRGRKIALALLTPSQWLLENALSRSGLPPDQVTSIMKSVVAKNASPDARTDFVAGKVDAAVVWEPDVTEALEMRPGAHVLVSSASSGYDHLLADCMVARQQFIDQHPAAIRAFIRGWLDGTVLAQKDHDLVVRLLMGNEPLYKSLGSIKTRQDLSTVKWADLNDNVQMFGLDGRPPLFDDLFSRASRLWLSRGVITKAMSPKDAVDNHFLSEIYRPQH